MHWGSASPADNKSFRQKSALAKGNRIIGRNEHVRPTCQSQRQYELDQDDCLQIVVESGHEEQHK